MAKTNPQVDDYFAALQQWRDELAALRRIALACQLTEHLKWGQPCYTHSNKNIALLGEFKTDCTLSFFKGALLQDPKGILRKPGENTRAARVVRFTDVDEILAQEAVLKAYLREAVRVEQEGRQVDFAQDREVAMPAEFENKLDQNPALREAFESLSPGRQRAYLLHFAGAKQSSTRAARVDKYAPQILAGMGIHDCTCGHTKRPPSCDGSHKHYQ